MGGKTEALLLGTYLVFAVAMDIRSFRDLTIQLQPHRAKAVFVEWNLEVRRSPYRLELPRLPVSERHSHCVLLLGDSNDGDHVLSAMCRQGVASLSPYGFW